MFAGAFTSGADQTPRIVPDLHYRQAARKFVLSTSQESPYESWWLRGRAHVKGVTAVTQHFFCNAMPIGEIQGDVAVVRFVMESPLDHGGVPAGIDGVFTPHAARAAAEVFNRLANEMEERRANPPSVAVYRRPAR